MKKLKEFEGSVDINADITPVTRQKIDQVHPHKWNDMTISELWDQRNILQTRINLSWSSNHAEIAKQLQYGINNIDEIIKHKTKQETDTNKITLL